MAADSVKETLNSMMTTLAYFKKQEPCTICDDMGWPIHDPACIDMVSHLEHHVAELKKTYRRELLILLRNLYRQYGEYPSDDSEIRAEFDTIISKFNTECGKVCINCKKVRPIIAYTGHYEVESHYSYDFDADDGGYVCSE